nr:low molecular weight phosphatase family protein [Mycolicibacterium baixiangningiae]
MSRFRWEETVLHALFVCTGNICRSPTAERLAIAYGSLHGLEDFTASSAGTSAVIGHPIHEDAALVLERLGGATSNFAARQLTAKIAADADLIITMTTSHRDFVLRVAPRQLHRTYTLAEAAWLATEFGAHSVRDLSVRRAQVPSGAIMDIPDPIGQDPEVFSEVGARIADLLPPVLELRETD